jgi:hypothetical protein
VCHEHLEEVRNCSTDEGRSFGIGLQHLVPNHPQLLGSKAPVVNVRGKGAGRKRQVGVREMSASEPIDEASKQSHDHVRTRACSMSWDELGGKLAIDLAACGVEKA